MYKLPFIDFKMKSMNPRVAPVINPSNSEPVMQNFLQNHNPMNPFAVTKMNIATMNAITNIPPQYFNGSQLLELYNVPSVTPSSSSIKKTTIAIIIAYTYPGLLNDLKTYWTNSINFGIKSTPPKVNVYTMPGAKQNTAWAEEECLDVQVVCTINPNANIWVVEAKSDTVTDLMAAIQYASNTIKADVISMSWGGMDNKAFANFNNNFTNTSICYCASSGDTHFASWPAVSSNCMAVGGTTLLWTPNAEDPRTEYTWNGAGCGYSISTLQPNYQKNITTIKHKYRVIPDLSLVANPQSSIYTVYRGKWAGVGGTSVAAPIMAGMLSIANQMRFNDGKSALTTVYTSTPSIATSDAYIPPSNNVQNHLYKTVTPNARLYNDVFYNITIGADAGSVEGNSNKLTTYYASDNFDIPTGLGSPNCKHLCDSLLTL